MGRGDTVSQVRFLAERYGVSERTVYRWFKEMREQHDPLLDQADQIAAFLEKIASTERCISCGRPLPAESTIRRRFCDDRCRIANHRARKQHDR
jgi:predicted nucleic acid-binding Zn ribbon protein